MRLEPDERESRFHVGSSIGRVLGLLLALCVCLCAHASVKRLSDARYDSPGNPTENLFDLWTPNTGVASDSVTAIVLPGGSYVTCYRSSTEEYCRRLADLGYNVINMTYTLAREGQPSFPQPVIDTLNMVRWVRTTGAQTLGLPGKVVIIGFSAGATIGGTAAMACDLGAFPLPPAPPDRGYAVDGFIGNFGRYDVLWNATQFPSGVPSAIYYYLGRWYSNTPIAQQLYAAGSAVSYVTPCAPPTALWTSDDDGTVPYQNTVRLGQALNAAGVPVRVTITTGFGHSTGACGGVLFDTGCADNSALVIPWLLSQAQPDCHRDGTALPIGACCTPGRCATSFQSICQGVFMGVGTVCEPSPCPPLGACCDRDEQECFLTYQTWCTQGENERTWGGPDSVCGPVTCPAPGACCTDGVCTYTFPSECASGDFRQDQVCSNQPCPVPSACCVNGACTLLLQSECLGAWMSGTLTCGPNPCPQPAACCTGSVCTFDLRSGCAGVSIPDTACEPSTCVIFITGACCAGATCQLTLASGCAEPRTRFMSGEPACNAGAPRTPCCLADFDHNNQVAVQDIFSYLSAWFAKSRSAGILSNGAAVPVVQDIFAFLSAWFAGCP